MKSAAVVSAGAVAGLGGLSQLSSPAAAAGASRLGAWSSGLGRGLAQWPLIPLHAVLLGDGRLLTYGTTGSGQQTGYFIYDIWDPRAGLGPNSHLTLPNTTRTDIFCSAQIVLPQSGNVLIAGGDNWTGTSTTNTGNDRSNIFLPGDNTLHQDAQVMQRPRWYASPVTLPDGRTYIQGGSNGGEDYPEIRDSNGIFRLLTGAYTPVNWFYPRSRVAPNGLVFGYSDLDMYYVDPNANGGNGSFIPAGTMPSDGPSGVTSTDVMYAPGRILRCGGGSNSYGEQGSSSTTPAKNAAVVIDINGATPTYKKQPSMPLPLHWANATVLADGNVVVTGGSAVPNELAGTNTSALLWKADTGSWTQGAQSTPNVARMYHSVALLLPDGSVLSGGGGAPGPQTNLNAEVYYPPYLFTNSGVFAPRPTITSVNGNPGDNGSISIRYSQPLDVTVSPAAGIRRATFIKTASVTHSCNFEQRFMELSFTPTAGGVRVQAPSSAALAPPGNYLLFVIDKHGVPSVAKIVQIG